MSIFSKRENIQSSQDSIIYPNTIPTSEGHDLIITESAKESYQIRAGMYISDVMMEESVFEGTSTVDILLEGFATDMWTRIKSMFKTLMDKLKSWYEVVRRALSLIFSSGKEFVTKFETEIRGKNPKGFKYKGFKYTIESAQSAVSDKLGKIAKAHEDYAKDIEGNAVSSSAHQDALTKHKDTLQSEYNAENSKEELLKVLGAESLSEFQDNLKKACRNNETEKQEFESFNGPTREEMMTSLKNKDKTINVITEKEKKATTLINRSITAINQAANKFKGDDYSKIAPFVGHSSEMMRFTITLVSTIARVEIDAYKEEARDYQSILKTFLRFKVVKDSFNSIDGYTPSNSILEAAIRSL